MSPSRALMHPAAKPLVFVAALLPFAWLFYGALTDNLGANPTSIESHREIFCQLSCPGSNSRVAAEEGLVPSQTKVMKRHLSAIVISLVVRILWSSQPDKCDETSSHTTIPPRFSR